MLPLSATLDRRLYAPDTHVDGSLRPTSTADCQEPLNGATFGSTNPSATEPLITTRDAGLGDIGRAPGTADGAFTAEWKSIRRPDRTRVQWQMVGLQLGERHPALAGQLADTRESSRATRAELEAVARADSGLWETTTMTRALSEPPNFRCCNLRAAIGERTRWYELPEPAH